MTAAPARAGVDIRPRLLRLVALGSALLLLAVFGVIAVLLDGGVSINAATTQRSVTLADQIAMFGLGVVAAAAVLLLLRPRVQADSSGVRVRGVLTDKGYPWGVVVGVRFDDDTPWAQLELHDDEVVALLAVQAADKGRAFDAVEGLRRLHRESRATPAAEPGRPADGPA